MTSKYGMDGPHSRLSMLHTRLLADVEGDDEELNDRKGKGLDMLEKVYRPSTPGAHGQE
jgi:hypothetical protein